MGKCNFREVIFTIFQKFGISGIKKKIQESFCYLKVLEIVNFWYLWQEKNQRKHFIICKPVSEIFYVIKQGSSGWLNISLKVKKGNIL